MKKILTSVAMVLLLAGCAKEYDDSGIRARLDAVETKLNELEGNIMALQSAIGEGVFVAKVQEHIDADSGKTDGVTIHYTNGDVKWFRIETNVADVNDPVIGVISSGSGALVWAVNGTAILIEGKEIPVYQTPVFSLDEEGYLWVEVDGKKTKLGQVQNEGATLKDGIFTDIKVVDDTEGKRVVLTLSDNSIVNIPFAEAFKLVLETSQAIYTSTYKAIEIPYTVKAKTAGTLVDATGYSKRDFEVVIDGEKIYITPLKSDATAVMMVYADSKIGLTSIETLNVEPEGVSVVDEPYDATVDYVASGNDGVVTAHVVSNIPFDVKPLDDWIKLVSVKGTLHTLEFTLKDYAGEDPRLGCVNLTKKGSDEVIQSFTILQTPGTPAPAGPVNLSAKGVANSYVVYEAGEYQFAAVKGNSLESVGAIDKVEVLWETVNTSTAPAVKDVIAEVGLNGSYITFSTPETLVPGNALIAAKDETGAVLWSWHIWIPATEIALQSNTELVSKDIMDRDLGALEASPVASALRYQWGRKDPLVPADFGATVALVKVDRDPENIGIEYAIQHPTEYIKGSENSGLGNWCKDPAEHLWNDADGKKTIYDPCPAGYRVPVGSTSSGEKLWVVSDAGWAAVSGGVAYGEIVFPYDGYLESSGSASTGLYHGADRTMLWSATYSSVDKAIVAYLRGGKVYNNSYYQYVGGNVRCVVDDGEPVIPPAPISYVDLSKDGSANSYIVSEAGNFKFLAVKGNSEESVGTVKTAEVLWETVNTSTAPAVKDVIAEVGLNGSHITFSTPETLVPGNALIAAKDETGAVLWSWHIWIPATEIALQSNTELVSKDIMDRDLGALEASPVASALRYQWGRKDPLVPADFGATVALVKVDRDPENIGIEYAIQHPTEYIKGSENSGLGNWCKDPAEHLWNDADGKKTIYDPCPAGYRVPVGSTSSGEKLWVVSDAGWAAVSGGVAYGEIVFPYDGYLESSGSASTGLYHGADRTMLWSATYSSVDKAIVAYLRGGKVYNNSYYQYVGGNVRCVVE